MKEKHRMIVVFSVFLLMVIAFSVFIYRVSGSNKNDIPQSQRQIKKIETYFFALDPHSSLGKKEKTEFLMEVENDRIVIPIEVEEFKDFEHGGYYKNREWWDSWGRKNVVFNIKTSPVATFWKGGKKIKIEQMNIICIDGNKEIPNIYSIFEKGAKIELRLSANLDLKYGGYASKWVLEERGNWKEDGNDIFTLAVCSDYEIITPTKKVKFI